MAPIKGKAKGLPHLVTDHERHKLAVAVELVSKELNHLAAILHVYAGGLNFMK